LKPYISAVTELATIRTFQENALRIKENHVPEGTAARFFVCLLFPVRRKEPFCPVRFSSFIELVKPKLSGTKVSYALSQLREIVDCGVS